MVPAFTSIRSCQRRAKSLRVATLITGTAAKPYGVPRPVVNTCRFMPAASCSVPQMKSLAGVAAKHNPLALSFSPGASTLEIGAEPDLTIEPIAFSTMFDRPPLLLPGVVLALRSAPPRCRYASYQAISRIIASATSGVVAREVSWSMPSRTSVTSENITLAPARTNRSVQKPTAGLAVKPEKASLPPH